jgi:hypothetical protein
MQLVTPRLVAMAVKIATIVCIINFQVSFFIMVIGYRLLVIEIV